MKFASNKLLAITSSVITALGAYSQSAVALDINNATIGMAIVGGSNSLPWSVTANKEAGKTGALGLYITGASTVVSPSNAITITATGNQNIQGILMNGQSTLDFGSENIVNSDGGGIHVQDSSIFTADKLSINAGAAVEGPFNNLPSRSALALSDSSSANLGSDSKLTITGSRIFGAHVGSGSNLKAEGLLIESTNTAPSSAAPPLYAGLRVSDGDAFLGNGSKVITKGMDSIFISNTLGLATNPLSFETTDNLYVELDTLGKRSIAMRVADGGNTKLGGTSTIVSKGENSGGGLYVGTGSSKTKNTSFEAATLHIMTETGDGIYVSNSASDPGYTATATINAGSSIQTKEGWGMSAFSKGAIIHFNGAADNRNTIISTRDASSLNGNNLTAVHASYAGEINLKYTDIIIEAAQLANGSSGILKLVGLEVADTGSVINADNLSITIKDSKNPHYGIYARTGGKVNLSGNTVIDVREGHGFAIASVRERIAGGYSAGTVTGSGKMTITGDMLASGADSLVDLNMEAGSLFTGSTIIDPLFRGTLNLTLTDSYWDMNQDSEVSKLVLNNSTVDFTENKTGSILQVTDLEANGATFIMRSNIAGVDADKLIVLGNSSGVHGLRVINRGDLNTTGDEVLTLVETADGQASFSLVNANQSVDLGGYKYNLRKSANNWELYATQGDGGSQITDTASAAGNFLNVGYLLNYAETQTLLQRMGELRQDNQNNGDVWARGFTGKFDSFGSGKLSGFDMDYSGLQIGADKRLKINDADLYLGIMGGTTKADSNYTKGSGDVKGYHAGIYGSYVNTNNFYIDAILKYSRLKNSFNVQRDQDRVNGSTSSNGYALSLEAGKRFYLGQTKNYYIEPQAQLSFSHQGSTSTKTNDGFQVDMDSYDTTLGRISALFGYEIKDGKNPVNVYVKTGVVADMSGDVEYRLNGSKEQHDFGGSWWDNGVGITAQINKQHNLYLDATYSSGSKFNQTQINAGYRYSF